MTENIIRASQQRTQAWAGGTTTQLAIEPSDALYADRSFSWRLSTASVSTFESRFTVLPHISRVLMVLQGELTLVHQGHHRAHLSPFLQDRFDGGWETISFGTAIDLNLMMAKGVKGSLEAIRLEENASFDLVFGKSDQTLAVYLLDGILSFDRSGTHHFLAKHDLLLLKRHSRHLLPCFLKGEEASSFVLARMTR